MVKTDGFFVNQYSQISYLFADEKGPNNQKTGTIIDIYKRWKFKTFNSWVVFNSNKQLFNVTFKLDLLHDGGAPSSSNEEKNLSSTEDDQNMNGEDKVDEGESGEDIQENVSYSHSNFEEEEEDTEGSIAEEIEASE